MTSLEKVIIVGVQTTEDDQRFTYSMDELEHLAENAGGQVVERVVQKRDSIDPRTFIGKGKVKDLKELAESEEVQTIIFNQNLSPSQVRNIQEEVDAKILDRMQLILDIFAMRADSKEGRLQVELAQLQYLLPRLSGQYDNLSRLGGGIGTRGPGETKLETDRRYIQRQISDIRSELEKTDAHRERNRYRRRESGVFQIGLVGYTNAGKSTLLNRLTDKPDAAYEKDELFATLDPMTRKVDLPTGMQVTLTDTVGFIQDLPTELVKAFESTLEETYNCDLLIQVFDASEDNLLAQEETVQDLLEDFDLDHHPRLTVYNKKDQIEGDFTPTLYPHLLISAQDPEDIDQLKVQIMEKMEEMFLPYELRIGADRGDLLVKIKRETLVESEHFDSELHAYLIKGKAKPSSPWIKLSEDQKEKI